MFWIALGVAALMAALFVWVAWFEPRQMHIRRHTHALPALTTPLRLVVVADLQPNIYHWPGPRLKSLFAHLSETEAPDLVLWLGDYYNAPTDVVKEAADRHPAIGQLIARQLTSMDDIADAMTALPGRMGSFAILGNHDWAWSGEETRRAIEAQGIAVLQDDCAEVERADGSRVQIAGYEDLSSGRKPDFAGLHSQLDPEAAQIALAHSPDTFPLAHGGPPLMLSGHTHGGQVRLPFIGPLLLPVENRSYDQGWFTMGARHLFVSSGVGTSGPPFRLLCPPEVVVIDLIPEKG